MKSKKPIKKTKIMRIVFLIFLVMSNTFAWFIYATKIDSSVQVHVRSWNVVFEAGENQITDIVNLNVDSVYPGMSDYSYEIKAYNHSEVSATLSYVILEANIMGDQYITKEGREERGEQEVLTDLTSLQLQSQLANSYPFHITISITNNVIQLGNGLEKYILGVTWPYESNNDALDTSWGIRADQYKRSNSGSSSITLKIKIVITQNVS